MSNIEWTNVYNFKLEFEIKKIHATQGTCKYMLFPGSKCKCNIVMKPMSQGRRSPKALTIHTIVYNYKGEITCEFDKTQGDWMRLMMNVNSLGTSMNKESAN